MKKYKVIFPPLITAFLIVASCSVYENEQSKISSNFILSTTQIKIEGVAFAYKNAYLSASDSLTKKIIQQTYTKKFESLMYGSVGNHLDSIYVVVDSVKESAMLLTSFFHTENLLFQFGMQYKNSMNKFVRNEYEFVRKLKPGSSHLLDFIFLGGYEILAPSNASDKSIRLFAYPVIPN